MKILLVIENVQDHQILLPQNLSIIKGMFQRRRILTEQIAYGHKKIPAPKFKNQRFFKKKNQILQVKVF